MTKCGSCLCGAISYKVTGALRPVVACHCGQCRKQTGLYYAATNTDDENLIIEDPAQNLTWYQSSSEAKRGFCGVCGSALFWKLERDTHTSILAGSLDEPTELKIEKHIFVADKGDFYDLTDGLPQAQGARFQD